MRNTLIVLLYLSLSIFANQVAASGTSLSSFTSGGSSFNTGESDFLRVDEAFIFSSAQEKDGLRLKWDIADEYYLYKERFKFRLVDSSKAAQVEIGTAEFSKPGKPKQDDYFGLVHAHYDDLEIFVPISMQASLADAEIKISYQGCAEAGLCYPPRHQKVLFVQQSDSDNLAASVSTDNVSTDNVSTDNASTDKGVSKLTSLPRPEASDFDDAAGVFGFLKDNSLLVIVGIFFLLGIGLTFTPCVFPMIPIITTIIAGQKEPTVGKSFLLALAYVLGMAITYAAAGVLTGILGAGANVQAALQDPILLSVFAAIFVLLALAMFGLYELQLPAFLRDRLNNTSQNLSGGHVSSVFFIGALSALIVSPCVSAPLAGALLYISSTQDAVIGGLSLFALGMGMGVPLILIAMGGGKFLPKAGPWMDKVKFAFGVMLIAVAIWLLGRFVSASTSMVLWALLCGLTATQMGAFEAAKPGIERLSKGLGLFLAIYALLLFIGAFTQASNPLSPLENLTAKKASPQAIANKLSFKTIYSEKDLENHLALAEEQTLPVLVDFYADWCISCKVMENEVFPLQNINDKMQNFYLLKADVTENSIENKKLLERFGLFGPPSILFFSKQGEELKTSRIVGEISADGFDARLTQALEKI